MAAEAIHLSALSDAREDALLEPGLRALLAQPSLWQAARLGALIVDFPYFERFAWKALCYALKQPQPASRWGDLFHKRCPVAIGRGLVRAAQRLAGGRGRRMLALAVGYFSHLAVDTCTHPLVNRLARARAQLSGDEMVHHRDVEKYQSVLFHEQRNGYDFLGDPAVAAYVRVEARWLHRDRASFAAWQCAYRESLGEAPRLREVRSWARGYQQYSWLLGSFLGGRLVSERSKRQQRGQVFETPTFSYPEVFRRAVRRCVRYMNAAWRNFHGASFDEGSVPEGCIDDPPAHVVAAC